jgi:hypothetical protein
MITYLTDDDVIKGREGHAPYDYKIPRESLNRSEIVVHVKDGYIMRILKHRHTMEKTIIKLKQLGLRF